MMLFPKQKSQKKRKKHKASILQMKDGTCYLCVKLNGDFRLKDLQEHHVFGGPRRGISEAEGLKVYLCIDHHTDGPEAVHNNHKNMLILQQDAQRVFETFHGRDEWMQLMGKNYLEE